MISDQGAGNEGLVGTLSFPHYQDSVEHWSARAVTPAAVRGTGAALAAEFVPL
jgi:hypothetical protein